MMSIIVVVLLTFFIVHTNADIYEYSDIVLPCADASYFSANGLVLSIGGQCAGSYTPYSIVPSTSGHNNNIQDISGEIYVTNALFTATSRAIVLGSTTAACNTSTVAVCTDGPKIVEATLETCATSHSGTTMATTAVLHDGGVGYSALLYDGSLYFVGGTDSSATPVSSVTIVDPDTMVQTSGPTLPDPRAGGAAEVLDGKILYCGGQTVDATQSFCLSMDGTSWDAVPTHFATDPDATFSLLALDTQTVVFFSSVSQVCVLVSSKLQCENWYMPPPLEAFYPIPVSESALYLFGTGPGNAIFPPVSVILNCTNCSGSCFYGACMCATAHCGPTCTGDNALWVTLGSVWLPVFALALALLCPLFICANISIQCMIPTQFTLLFISPIFFVMGFVWTDLLFLVLLVIALVWVPFKMMIAHFGGTWSYLFLVAFCGDLVIFLIHILSLTLTMGADASFNAETLSSFSRRVALLAISFSAVLAIFTALAFLIRLDQTIWQKRIMFRTCFRDVDTVSRAGFLIRHQSLPVKRAYLKYQVLRVRPPGTPKDVIRADRDDPLAACQAMVSATKLKIRRTMVVLFSGEVGIDAGGLSREFLRMVVTKLLADGAVLEMRPGGYYAAPGPLTSDAEDQCTLLGILLGRALIDGHVLPLNASHTLYRVLLGHKIVPGDLKAVDAELYSQIESLKHITELEKLGLFFVDDQDPEHPVDLVRNGGSTLVTDATVHRFVRLKTMALLTGAYRQERLALIRAGWSRVVSPIDMTIFIAMDLALLLEGGVSIDIHDWRKHTIYTNGYTAHCDAIVWFWRAIEDLTQEERKAVIRFVTGNASVPASGFAGLPGRVKFEVTKGKPGRLPEAHACFNALVLAEPSSEADVLDQIRWILELDPDSLGFHLS
ncbi:HECT-domain (ubiquitin-transferase) [Carpediemonas membranifera]|uniref:HECT-type E3 ubiquitin transferase n=1 Tax=Carpediemonas membranifera TaxID=201153 RepID=A0A8J6B1Y4_9EUKA|nr:HECT-domain (ubiquitin-transferase) [Carpediemonas membranifera]|eukprot:KAG9391169.1 HECT-domain (ubiquitin-transferase) [Carpediemonas membranifera]